MPDNSSRKDQRPSADTGDRQVNRHDWFWERRRLPDGTIALDTIARGSRQKRAIERQEAEARAREFRPRVAGPAVPPYWTPLGPSVVANGQASGHPYVSGRITSLAVGAGGTRVYAGSANGGIWYSEDSGSTWTPIDEYALAGHAAALRLEADSLATGAIAVRFGANAAADTIFVGTGEPQSAFNIASPSSPNLGDAYFGVGIKTSTSGGASASWNLEAGAQLAGHGIFRIAIDPDHPEIVLAATSIGLYQRPVAAPFDNWTAITAGLPAGVSVTDVLIAGRGANRIYFAAVAPISIPQPGVVYRAQNPAGPWTAVAGFTTTGRAVLAASDVPASGATAPIVYVLDENAKLYRLDAAPTGNFQQVTGVPHGLFFGGQGGYDIALAVDPSDPNTVYMAGDTVKADDWDLSFFKGTITGSAPNYVFPFNPSNDMTGSGTTADSSHVHNDPTWI